VLTYLHADHLDTPRWGTDAAGTLVWRWKSDGFGEALPEEDVDGDQVPVTVNLRFPGQVFDAESGLHQNWHRDYTSVYGRYISADPIGQVDGPNVYAYVRNNPANVIDPLGLYQMCHRDLVYDLWYARHCYVRFSDGTTSSYTNEGVDEDADPEQEGTICTAAQEPEKDDCVEKAMQRCRASSYGLTKSNCCHCVEDALKACNTSVPQNSWPNWPVNPGPQRGEPGYSTEPRFGGDGE